MGPRTEPGQPLGVFGVIFIAAVAQLIARRASVTGTLIGQNKCLLKEF